MKGDLPGAERLLRDYVERLRKLPGPEGQAFVARGSAELGRTLLQQQKYAEAEPVLRDCLAFRERAEPDAWSTFNTRAQLGGALLGQGRYAEAEPQIVSGYEGMQARAATIPPQGRPLLAEAALKVVRLYEAWGKPEKAADWRAKLGLNELPADPFQH
jgi:hypothetical protein